MTPTLSAEEIRDVNTRYHDVAADHYDAKWGIDFGDVGQAQVLEGAQGARPRGSPAGPFARSLEIGAGTGYFTLNLMRAGLIEQATCTDISPGMLSALSANAQRLGLDVTTAPTDAESLPFQDASFDLVIGHAILHHIPDLGQRVPRVRARAGARRHRAVRGRALALRGSARESPQARGERRGAAVAAGDRRARPPRPPTAARPRRRWRDSWTCTRSRRAN